MKVIIAFLGQAVVFLTLAKSSLEMLDPNKEGWDDQAAEFLDRIINEIKLFIGTHPVEPSTVAKGYAAILAFCNNVIQQMDLVISTPAPKAEKVARLEELASDLHDPEKVYQAQKGKDAEVLQATKVKAQERINRVSEEEKE